MKKKILAIIPARGGSKGVPNKNIKLLNKIPLIVYTFEALKNSKFDIKTFVSTDSVKIADIARDNGINVPILRPKKYSRDDSNINDYIIHVLNYFKTSDNYEPDFILILQPTTPLRSSLDIDNCIQLMMKNSQIDSIVSVTQIERKYHPNWQFTITLEGHLNFYEKNNNWKDVTKRRQDLDPTYTRNGAIYMFRLETFSLYKNIYGKNVLSYIMPSNRSFNIDSLIDWENLENHIRKSDNE